MFHPGDPVWIFYKTTKQIEKAEWVRATVVSAEYHALIARRSQRGPPMRAAYEDVPFDPRSQLTTELLSSSLEENPNAAFEASRLDDSETPEDNSSDPSHPRPVEDDPPPAPAAPDSSPIASPPVTSLPPVQPPLLPNLQLRDTPLLWQ